MIIAGKTLTVLFADGHREVVTIKNSDEMSFERREKISLTRVLADDGSVPLWVIAGIVHWRLIRSDAEGIPADLDDFIDLLDPTEWLEEVDEGKVVASDPTPATG